MWPTVFMAAFSVGMLLPLESYISLNFFAQRYTDLNPKQIHCETAPDVQHCKNAVNDNVKWTGIASTIAVVVHICLGPAIGVISDAYGRKPVIVVCGVLGLIPSVAQALFIYWNVSLYLWYGLYLFSHLPVVAAWFALITDLVENVEHRAAAFGFVLVAWESSMLMGMVAGARLSLRTTVAVAMLVHVGNVFYLLLGLRESLPPHRRSSLKLGSMFPVTGLSIVTRNFQ